MNLPSFENDYLRFADNKYLLNMAFTTDFEDDLTTLEYRINGGYQISRGVRNFLKINKQGGSNNFRGVKIFPKTA